MKILDNAPIIDEEIADDPPTFADQVTALNEREDDEGGNKMKTLLSFATAILACLILLVGRVDFAIFSALCASGVFFSLARGKMH